MPAGRPTDYSPELADAICARLADGESLRSVCRDDGMPDKSTVFRWLRVEAGFSDQYARAKEESADSHADDILEIADDGRNDWMERQLKEGVTEQVINSEHINRSRLRVDTRKWLASKLKPKKYGERIATELTGANGGPVVIQATPLDEQL